MSDNRAEITLSAKDETRQAFDSINRNLKGLAATSEGLASTFRGVGAGLAAAFSIGSFAGFIGLIKGAIDAQDNLKDLSKTTQISIDDLAGLSSAAQKSGSDLENIASSINKLAVNMGKEPEKFRQIGITAKEPIEAFKQLADIFNAIEDPQERAAFGAAALGKSWAGAAPLLAEGSKSIGEMVEKGKSLSKVTAESAAKADELNDLLVDLKDSSKSLGDQIANALVPSMLETVKAMSRMIETGHPLDVMLASIGRQRLSFDPGFAGAAAQMKDLETELGSLQSKREKLLASGGGLLNEWMYGKQSDLEQKIKVTLSQLELMRKYGEAKPGASSRDAPLSGSKVAPDVRKFLDGDKPPAAVKPKAAKADAYSDLLTPAAQAYARAMEGINSNVLDADKSTMDLNASQQALYALMMSAEWDKMPDAWKATAIAQAEAGTAAIQTADDYKRLQALLAATPTARLEQTRGQMLFLADAFEAGKINAEQFSEAAQAALGTLPEQAKEATDAMSTFAEQAARNMQDAFADFLFDPFAKGTKSMLENFGNTIQKMVAQAASAQLSNVLFGKAAGGEGSGLFGEGVDWFKGLFSANASGGVYASPGLSAYSGSIVSRPTVFPFARGIGLMGESGAEAILPLSRGADGKLGVAASGSGGGVVVNVINNAGGAQARQTTRQDAGGKTIIDVMIETVKGAIASDIGSGGAVASAMENQYGLNRAAGAWR